MSVFRSSSSWPTVIRFAAGRLTFTRPCGLAYCPCLVRGALHGISGDKVFPVVGTGFVAMAAHSPRKVRRVLRHLKQGSSKGKQSLEPNIPGCGVAYVSLASGGRHRWLRGAAITEIERPDLRD